MAHLILGILLLVVGIGATVASPNTVFYGAIVVGIINIFRGIAALGAQPRNTDHQSTWE